MLLLTLLAAAPTSDAITPASLAAHVRFLASDELEGRGPGTRGDRLTQRYLSSQFELLGLEGGAGDGGFLQPFELVSVDGHPESVRVTSRDAGLTLLHRKDVVIVAGQQQPQARVEGAELVFVGYGIVAPEYVWDDFKGVDVTGKVLVMLNNDPSADPAIFKGETRLWYGRWDYKYQQAAKRGAAGCLLIHTTPSAGYPFSVVQTSWTGPQFALPSKAAGLVFSGWLSEDAAMRVAQLGAKKLDTLRAQAERRDFRPVALGVTLSAAFASTVTSTVSANVLGVLRGADATLKNEYVVVTAHHDHLGKTADLPDGGDVISNGAIDNATGVAELLTLARALRDGPRPKRSILFAAVAGEEQGLLGSQYFVAHSTVPLSAIVADVNFDGANVFGRTSDVTVVGVGKSSLDLVLVDLARSQGRIVRSDGQPDKGLFYRSDQFNFAKAGIPSAYFQSGEEVIGKPKGWGRAQRDEYLAKRYHQVSDEVRPEWDWSGAVEDAQLAYGLIVRVANQVERPTWNDGDEFAPKK